MAHKDIRIQFKVDGRRYEAVGFLDENESSISGDEMIRRTAGENGGAIRDEDGAFFSDHLAPLSRELWPYLLVISHNSRPNYLEVVLRFGFECRLYKGWDVPSYHWGNSSTLVVRRLT